MLSINIIIIYCYCNNLLLYILLNEEQGMYNYQFIIITPYCWNYTKNKISCRSCVCRVIIYGGHRRLVQWQQWGISLCSRCSRGGGLGVWKSQRGWIHMPLRSSWSVSSASWMEWRTRPSAPGDGSWHPPSWLRGSSCIGSMQNSPKMEKDEVIYWPGDSYRIMSGRVTCKSCGSHVITIQVMW